MAGRHSEHVDDGHMMAPMREAAAHVVVDDAGHGGGDDERMVDMLVLGIADVESRMEMTRADMAGKKAREDDAASMKEWEDDVARMKGWEVDVADKRV